MKLSTYLEQAYAGGKDVRLDIGNGRDLLAEVRAIEDALDASRTTNMELHRRAQAAEGIIAKAGLMENRPQRGHGRSLGRALANYAASQYERERNLMAGALRQIKRMTACNIERECDAEKEHPQNCIRCLVDRVLEGVRA